MYIRPQRRRPRSSPIRILFLLMLISAGIYVYAMIKQEQIENPFIPTPLPPTPTRSAFSYADEATELYLQGNLARAIAAYEQAITLEPDDVLLYIPQARLLALEGRPVEAVRRANRAVEIAPENARAWAVLGMAYDWNGDVPEAIDACKRAIELDPTYAEAYAYLAEAYADAVRWAEATDAGQTALQLDDRSVDAHRNYGYVLEKQGNYWGAAEEYEQALNIHPNLAYIHIAAGRNYQVLGDLGAAESSYQRAIEIDPDNVEAYYRLGRAYYEAGEYERAETYLKQATEADTEFAPAFGYLAFTYWSRRNYEAAIESLEHAIKVACLEARRQAETFYITVENLNDAATSPSPGVLMRGDFAPTSENNRDELQATLAPTDDTEAWSSTHGAVTLNAQTGKYTVALAGLPILEPGLAYVGWFKGINTLSGDPLSTGPLDLPADGSLEAEFETAWVEGPRIEYFYTLGLAYFYMAECEKSYPLFDAALQIDSEDVNALEGIRLCQEAEETE
ncbi:MAG TPA: tetratricopeptide repeat protein [Thermoflexia bacterium]|nr:tetratricopeptide repeat protein [Thermoflexia bacterium]